MSAILILSIAIRVMATGWAIYMLAHIRDWRIGFVVGMAVLLTASQIWTLPGLPSEISISYSANLAEFTGLGISIFGVMSVYFISELIRSDRSRVEILSELYGTQKTILDNAQIVIVLVKKRKIVWANNYFTTLLGWTPEEYGGKRTRFLYPDDESHQELAKSAVPTLAAGGVVDQETELIRKDGTHLWVRMVGRAIDPNDRDQGNIWLIEDISKDKERDEERAELTERLKRTVKRLENSQNIARLANWELDTVTQTLWWSDEVYRMVGIEPSGLQPTLESAMAITHPDDRAKVLESLNKSIDDGTPYEAVKRVTRPDGREIVLHDYGEPVFNADGTLIRISGISQDITASARAEKELRENEARLRGLLANSTAAIASADLKGNFTYWNKAFEELTGYSGEELKTLSNRDISHPDDMESAREVFRKMVRGKIDQFRREKRFLRKDGTVIWGDLSASAVRDQDGNLVEVLGVIADITEKKLAENALIASESRLKFEQEIAGLASWIYEPQTDTHVWSEELHDMLGFESDDIDLNIETMRALSHPDDRDKVMQALDSVTTGGADVYSVVHRVYRKDGTELVVHDHGVPERDECGAVVRIMGVSQNITELSLIETALREREALLSMVLDHSFDGILTLKPIRDGDGKISDFEYTATSKSAIKTLGYDLTGRRLLDAFPTAPEDGMFNQYIEAVETGRTIHTERSFAGLVSGDPWFRVVVTPTGGGLTVAFSDITEMKIAEQALEQSEARHRGILANSAVAIASNDADGKFLYWNGAFEQFIGYSGDELAKMYLADITHEEEYQTASNNFLELKYGKIDSFRREKKYLRRDGTAIWGDVSGSAIRDEDGKLIQTIAVVVDLTDRKRAEIELKTREAVLSTVLERSFDGLVTLIAIRNGDGQIVDFEYTSSSGKAAEILCQDPVGKRLLEIFPTARTSGQFDRYKEVVETGQAVDVEIQYVDLLPGDPWIRMVVAPMEDGIATAFSDVTEQHEAKEALKTAYAEMETRVESRTQDLKTELIRGQRTQDELKKAKELAEQANRTKSEFLSRVSHELRTPMNAILGFSQLLQHDKNSPLAGDQSLYVNEIMSASDHLMELISQLLDMSKIETGNMGLSMGAQAPAALIEECVAMTLAQADARKITIHWNAGGEDLPAIYTDPLRFKQILLNLMSNAVKYNRDNGEVLIDCEITNNNTFRLTVTDQGPGIPPDKHGSVFEPFNRAGAEYMDIPGTGIGLAIAKQMVELMGGEIGLESAQGDGCRFWFTIPLATKPSAVPLTT